MDSLKIICKDNKDDIAIKCRRIIMAINKRHFKNIRCLNKSTILQQYKLLDFNFKNQFTYEHTIISLNNLMKIIDLHKLQFKDFS